MNMRGLDLGDPSTIIDLHASIVLDLSFVLWT